VGGDSMRGQTLVLRDPIPVGAKRELSIEMAVPSGQTGLIQSSWQMADSNGIFFGDTLTVNIQVGNITTPVVTVTP
jgi:predicted carbohydrate-binding protein with CBM5 and CBM33 domain